MQIRKYLSKIPGPLLDRIDIHLDVPPVPFTELRESRPSETSAQIKERVVQARAIQIERFKNDNAASAKKLDARLPDGQGSATLCGGNAHMSHRQIKKYCGLGKEENELLKQAMDELNFSARAHDKILKVARTIADLAESDAIKTEHLAEAIQYRALDRSWRG